VARLEDAGAALLLLLLATVVLLPRGLVATVHSARGAFHREVAVLTVSLAGLLAAPVLAALAGGAPLHAAAAQFAAAVLLGWVPLLRGLRRRYGDVPLRPLPPTRAELRVLAAKAPLYAMQQGSVAVLVNAPVLLLGWMAAPGAVVAFATLRTFVGLVRQLPQQIAVALGLEMARLHARGYPGGAGRLHADSAAALGCATGLLGGAAWVAGPPVFALWTHGTTPFDPTVAAVLLAGLLLRAPVQGAAATLRLVDRPGVVAAAQAAEVAALLLLGSALIPWAGAAGAALAVAAAEALVSGPWLLLAAGRLFGVGVLRPALRAGAAALAALALSLLAMRLAGLVAPPSEPAGLAAFLALWTAAGLPALLTALAPAQRAWLRTWLRGRGRPSPPSAALP
jgi:O-antigen/teichoic acid export membrane protein